MKILLIHADYFNYEVEKKSKVAEEISNAQRSGSMENILIAFISIEKSDENSGIGKEKLAGKAFEEIEDMVLNIKAKKVALFPFAHLSESLSSPDFAVSVLRKLEDRFKVSEFSSIRVPFGWYNEFEFKSKGHPLSVLSRTIRP